VRVLVSGSAVNGVSGDASVGRPSAKESLGERAYASRCVIRRETEAALLREAFPRLGSGGRSWPRTLGADPITTWQSTTGPASLSTWIHRAAARSIGCIANASDLPHLTLRCT
jgi:hypothetical protein